MRPNEGDWVSKSDTLMLKGVAIIMMVTGHVLNMSWAQGQSFIDLHAGGMPLSAIISEAFNICVAIYAFLTGYANGGGYTRKGKMQRILSLYISYWVIYIMINLPMIIVFDREVIQFHGLKKTICEVFAISSDVSRFNWYVFFLHWQPLLILR